VQIEQLAGKQPNNPLTYNLRGLALLAKRDTKQARAEFEHALKLQPAYYPAAHNLALLDRQAGDVKSARRRYEAVLEREPRNEQTLNALVQLLVDTAAPRAEIEAALKRALAANPQSVTTHLLNVGYWSRTGDTNRTLSAAQDARGAAPDNPAVLRALGFAQIAAGDTNQAISTFGRLVALQPRSPEPLLAQAEALAAAKSWDSVRQTLKRALDVQPDYKQTWSALIRLSLLSKDFEQGRKDAREMQKRWPDRIDGYIAEADVLQAEQKFDQARTVLKTALERKPDSNAAAAATIALLRREGKPDEADRFASRWLERHPKDAQLALYLAESSRLANDYPRAVRWYKAALKAQPDYVAALNNLVWLLGQMNDPEAGEYAQKALKLAPQHASVLDTVGWLDVQQGRLDSGLPLLERAHALAPTSAAITLNLAKALMKAGRTDDARTHLKALGDLPATAAERKEAEQLLAHTS
jgi:putative PEP-CTERM system TPR-repeat lipoprotein